MLFGEKTVPLKQRFKFVVPKRLRLKKCSLFRSQNTMSVTTNTESDESRFVELYRRFARSAIPNKATLNKNGDAYSLVVHYSQRDLDLMEKTSFKKYYNVNVNETGIESIICQSEPCDTTLELALKYSKSRQRKVVIKKNLKENAKFKSFIEIWEKDTKIKTLTPEVLEKNHGEISMGEDFSSLQWSPNEKCFLYTAEYKTPKSESFFKQNAENASIKTESEVTKGTEYLYKEDWGEGMDSVRHPCVYIVDVEDNFKIRCIEVENFSLGEAFWIDNDNIGCVAFNEEPYRLGMIYCPIRQSFLYSFDLREELLKPKILYGQDSNECIRSPRLNGKNILFLCNTAFGPHFKASKLMCYNFETKETEVLIDIDSTDGTFVPIYTKSLPENCFTADGKFILFDSVKNCCSVICMVDLQKKLLNILKSPVLAAHVMDVNHDVLVVSSSSPNQLPSVYVAKIKTEVVSFDFKKVEINSGQILDGVAYKTEELFIEENGKKIRLHTILIGPSSKMNSQCAAVILPHGGPHSSFTGDYIQTVALFAEIGLKTLLINYRGSIGVNEEYLNSLCGNVGDVDISDVMHCIKYQIEKGEIDKENIVLCSGSHGGFIVTHLCGQFPDFGFKACIARNPVIDISGMIEVTDIPDWCFTEVSGSEYKFGDFGNVESLITSFNKSPMKYVNNVKTPTMLMLGKNDRRVPMTQGIKYYKALKTRGVDVKCHIYDDKHDLQKVNVDSDAFIHIALWIYKYIDKQYKNIF